MNASEQTLLLGNAAAARGLYEAGCSFVSSYPGTPSTEISEEAAKYDEIYAEWAPNEKVALEAAFGASLGGARSFAAMKHVGMNVAADPLFTMSYTGVNAGLVVAVADDMGMHSSQNEQDSRHYAIAAKVPMLEPADSSECLVFVKVAYEISEQFDTPVMIRLTTRIAHSRSLVSLHERVEPERCAYQKNPQKYVMMPANARGRHVFVENRMAAIAEYAETSPLNRVIRGSSKLGIVASGIAFCYAREAFGDEASYLKLGMINPLPEKMIREFAASVDRLIVIEELDDVFETQIRKMGIPCEGKSLFSFLGEYSAELIRHAVCGEETTGYQLSEPIPGRPPVLCPGCPHRGVFHVLSKMKVFVSGDIGCYTLGALPPLAIDADKCRKCKACMKIGCPAISFDPSSGAKIDFSLCTGCGLCEKLCKFDAIGSTAERRNG